ncbi:hypothetical protein ACFQY7_24625 [Actinomadura luteofluorescens]|uniref:hypothetical protein n=1 Tax=Actinomadura luteofluorescens TaxID=46163 RepID=UPI00362B4736
MEPVEALRRIAFLLERAHEPTYRVRAFRTAADRAEQTAPDELAAAPATGPSPRCPASARSPPWSSRRRCAARPPSTCAAWRPRRASRWTRPRPRSARR